MASVDSVIGDPVDAWELESYLARYGWTKRTMKRPEHSNSAIDSIEAAHFVRITPCYFRER